MQDDPDRLRLSTGPDIAALCSLQGRRGLTWPWSVLAPFVRSEERSHLFGRFIERTTMNGADFIASATSFAEILSAGRVAWKASASVVRWTRERAQRNRGAAEQEEVPASQDLA